MLGACLFRYGGVDFIYAGTSRPIVGIVLGAIAAMPLSIPEPAEFLQVTQWSAILTGVCALIAVLGFIFKWGIRFRFVGVTGFMIVFTVGMFALSLVPITRTTIPGAARFTTVFDSGSTNVVIAVQPPISDETLVATLKQAASDYFSPGRLGRSNEKLTIRARAVLHPEPSVTEPLYLGQVRRSLQVRDDEQMEITLFQDNLAKLPAAPAAASDAATAS